jgi:hypothetical protein
MTSSASRLRADSCSARSAELDLVAGNQGVSAKSMLRDAQAQLIDVIRGGGQADFVLADLAPGSAAVTEPPAAPVPRVGTGADDRGRSDRAICSLGGVVRMGCFAV